MPVTWSLSIRDPILFGHNSLPQVWKKWLRRDPARVGAGRNTVPKHDSWENSLKWTGEASESKVRGQWKAMRVMSERSQNNYFWGGSHRESKALLPLQNGRPWTGASSRLPHLHCKRQIASTASLERKFLSLIVQVPMGLMDFIATFVGRKVSGALWSWVPFSSFHKMPPLSLSAQHLLKLLYFICEACEIGSQQPRVNNRDLWVRRAGSETSVRLLSPRLPRYRVKWKYWAR